MYNQFVADKSDGLNEVFANFKTEGISDLIVDLRYNGGGSVFNCIELASMITGQFSKQIFVQELWNSKMTEALTIDNGEEYFLDRLIYFLYTGCITLRLTFTVIVFSALSDTTTPFKILFGMSYFLPFIFLLKFNAVLILAICFFTTEILAVFSS